MAQDFISELEARLHSVRNREIYFENVDGCWDFRDRYAEMLQVKLSGICPSIYDPDVNHSLRILRRADVPTYDHKQGVAWDVMVLNKVWWLLCLFSKCSPSKEAQNCANCISGV